MDKQRPHHTALQKMMDDDQVTNPHMVLQTRFSRDRQLLTEYFADVFCGNYYQMIGLKYRANVVTIDFSGQEKLMDSHMIEGGGWVNEGKKIIEEDGKRVQW